MWAGLYKSSVLTLNLSQTCLSTTMHCELLLEPYFILANLRMFCEYSPRCLVYFNSDILEKFLLSTHSICSGNISGNISVWLVAHRKNKNSSLNNKKIEPYMCIHSGSISNLKNKSPLHTLLNNIFRFSKRSTDQRKGADFRGIV